MRSTFVILFTFLLTLPLTAQTEVRTEAQMTAASGDDAPLWLQANKYGLSSLDKTNGYIRAGVFRGMEADSAKQWAWAAAGDVAVATGFTSTLVVQQAYGEVRWLKGLLTIGSKEEPMELKNQLLSSGSQTLGINARPIPSVRLSLPEYWNIPGTKGWLALKGHIAYGMQTDDQWQKDFTGSQRNYTEHTRIHTKAGYLRFGPSDKPFTVEAGLEMGCQYGGTSEIWEYGEKHTIKNSQGLKGMWRALIPGGGDDLEIGTEYENADGNHVGSWVLRVNYDQPKWGVSAYFDHFFEDQSSMFLLDYNGYGEGEEWNTRKDSRWFLYDLRDILVGAELRLKDCNWIDGVVVEYIYSKYQSGPIYHDHTQTMPEHLGGNDNYYNHHIFPGWQHWGQVMGNPLYRSPLYDTDGWIDVEDNRFWAWHIGLSGKPADGLSYRLLCTWQKGFGTYNRPFTAPQRNLSFLAEAGYRFNKNSLLAGWSVKGAFAFDRGGLLGDNTGVQLTLARCISLNK